VWVCSLSYTAFKVHTAYYVVCGLFDSPIFPHYLINGTIFGENLPKIKYVLIFSTTFLRNISHSKKNWVRYDQKCILVFMQSTPYLCQILMEHEFSRQIFAKHSNIKFHENPSYGSRVIPCGQTDGGTDGQTWRMILGKWPTWRTILFYVFSSIFYMFRATSCSSSGESIVSIQHMVYFTLCRWPFRVQVGKLLPDLDTKRSRTRCDIYQMFYWHNWFSWWWARGCSKHVENWTKYIEKNCASSWSFAKNHNKMHRQQNIRFDALNCPFSQVCKRVPETLHFARTVHLCCWYYSYNKQRLFI